MLEMDVVCGILEKEGRYLIACRGSGIHENIWEFPGGKVEANESKMQAVVREIKEELELDVRVVAHACDIVDIRQDCTIYVSAFLCKIQAGTMVLHAHHEARFVTPQELYEYTFEEADRPLLDYVNRR